MSTWHFHIILKQTKNWSCLLLFLEQIRMISDSGSDFNNVFFVFSDTLSNRDFLVKKILTCAITSNSVCSCIGCFLLVFLITFLLIIWGKKSCFFYLLLKKISVTASKRLIKIQRKWVLNKKSSKIVFLKFYNIIFYIVAGNLCDIPRHWLLAKPSHCWISFCLRESS